MRKSPQNPKTLIEMDDNDEMNADPYCSNYDNKVDTMDEPTVLLEPKKNIVSNMVRVICSLILTQILII